MLPYLELLRVGFGKPACCQTAGALLPHHFNLTGSIKRSGLGGIFSVPLSVGSPRLDVIKHSVLWSPDFPRNPRDFATIQLTRIDCSTFRILVAEFPILLDVRLNSGD